MKKLIIIFIFSIALINCASTSGSGSFNKDWDYRTLTDSRGFYGALYNGYSPNYNNYVETTLEEAINLVVSGGNFDGYFYTEDLVVLDRVDNGFSLLPLTRIQQLENIGNIRNASSEAIYIRHSSLNSGRFTTSSEPLRQPDSWSIVTVWYRGISRTERLGGPFGELVKSGNLFIDKYEVTGQFTRQSDAERARRNLERQQPAFSPEGNEYIKRTLTQAVGEVNNPANRGRTLFFESSNLKVESGVSTGQYLVSELGSSSFTLMYYYGSASNVRFSIINPTLYRVEISSIGVARYTIDGFRE
ncbi:MAG: hypothetical protein FWD13_09585 [Treponema sp.]|nr:hypothetical protein [Treponema sp.]